MLRVWLHAPGEGAKSATDGSRFWLFWAARAMRNARTYLGADSLWCRRRRMRPSRDSRRSAPASEGRSACAGAATSFSTTTRCVSCLNLPLISHALVPTVFLLRRRQPRLDGRALTMRELQVDPALTAQRAVRPPPPPSPPSRTDWTRLVPPHVLTGHVSSLLPY